MFVLQEVRGGNRHSAGRLEYEVMKLRVDMVIMVSIVIVHASAISNGGAGARAYGRGDLHWARG